MKLLALLSLLLTGVSAFVSTGLSRSTFVGNTNVCFFEESQQQLCTKTRTSSTKIEMMRHRHGFNKLSKPADQRKALLRALTTEVIRHGRIKTTLIRAKAVRKHVDHMIELGKRGDLHARRQALGWIYDKSLVHSLFEAAPDRYGTQNGGYTRVLRTVARQGDNAKMAILELV